MSAHHPRSTEKHELLQLKTLQSNKIDKKKEEEEKKKTLEANWNPLRVVAGEV
jgi:hypothetical protein